MNHGQTKHRKRDSGPEESRRILERVQRDSESIGSSSFARVANQLRDHFAGADGEDRIEIWGKRIARMAALVAFVFLLLHLFANYVFADGV